MRDDRKPTSSTEPSISPEVIQSPIWKGLSMKIINDPKKFLMVSCAAKAKSQTSNGKTCKQWNNRDVKVLKDKQRTNSNHESL